MLRVPDLELRRVERRALRDALPEHVDGLENLLVLVERRPLAGAEVLRPRRRDDQTPLREPHIPHPRRVRLVDLVEDVLRRRVVAASMERERAVVAELEVRGLVRGVHGSEPVRARRDDVAVDRGRRDLIQRVPGLVIQLRPRRKVMPHAERRPRTTEHAVLDHPRLMPLEMPPHHVPLTGQFPPERDSSEPTMLPLRDRRVHVMLREEQATLPVNHPAQIRAAERGLHRRRTVEPLHRTVRHEHVVQHLRQARRVLHHERRPVTEQQPRRHLSDVRRDRDVEPGPCLTCRLLPAPERRREPSTQTPNAMRPRLRRHVPLLGLRREAAVNLGQPLRVADQPCVMHFRHSQHRHQIARGPRRITVRQHSGPPRLVVAGTGATAAPWS